MTFVLKAVLAACCLLQLALGFQPEYGVRSSSLQRLNKPSNVGTTNFKRLHLSPSPRLSLRLEQSSSSSTTTNSNNDVFSPLTKINGSSNPPIVNMEIVICGGGPAGLLTAIMLAQKGKSVHLYDRLSEPPSPDDDTVWSEIAKFYLIGLGQRGQNALKEFNVWDAVERRSVAVRGRKDWQPGAGPDGGVERIFDAKDKRVTTQVLPRDKLVGVLHEYILENYANKISLHYGYEVEPLNFEYGSDRKVLLQITKCNAEQARLNPASVVKTATEDQEKSDDILCEPDTARLVAADFCIAADGTVRTVANSMEKADRERYNKLNPLQKLFGGASVKPFQVTRYVDDNQRIYKTVPLKAPKDWRHDLNYSARTKEGRINFDALPANNQGDYCGVLLLKKGDVMAQADTDPAELRKLMDDALPQFSRLLDDESIATIARKPVSYLPAFRYAGPRLYQGERTLILGDCAHTVKPYFGLGANSALEDVRILSKVLDECKNDIPTSVKKFSQLRAADSKALVRISRDLDRPGKLGFLTFIGPLILDSIFSGMLPKLFAPNVIALLQREEYSFSQVARRKRLDRFMQLSLLAGTTTGLTFAAKWLVRTLVRVTGRNNVTVVAGLAAAGSGLFGLQKLATKSSKAPDDVMNKVSTRVTNSRTHLTPLRKLSKDPKPSVGNGESFLTPLQFDNTDEAELN